MAAAKKSSNKKSKKPAAKKPAAKKPAAKKPAAKKPAAKKPAAKKPAAKKPAAKKPSATKKPAAKKPAARKQPKAAPAEERSPGWEAIDGALARIYGDQKPLHWGTVLPAFLGGNDPIDGISAYKSDVGQPHWHLVTYGFSELHRKESDDATTSGFGFELTLRLGRGTEAHPPVWALNFLQNLGRYVFRTGNRFGVGHHMPLNGPIALGADTEIHGVAFTLDPQLGRIDTPFGEVKFLQVVGLARSESRALKAWKTEGILELLAERDPMLVTLLERPSLLDDPSVAAKIHERTDRDGSSSSMSFVTQLEVAQHRDHVHLTLGALGVDDLRTMLKGRLPYGRDYTLLGNDASVRFVPADAPAMTLGDGQLQLEASPALVEELRARLSPKRGTFRSSVLPSLTIEVVPTEIKDQSGNVMEVVG